MRKDAQRDTFTPASTRLLRDQAAVDCSLPGATRDLVVDGVRGWLYPIDSEIGGDHFVLFVYFDGSAYQVKVVEPDVGGHDPHACHLFPDGRICLGEHAGGGMPRLADAYSRSVVWCTGFSVYLRTSKFPF